MIRTIAATFILLALPAEASTMPRLDFGGAHHAVALGAVSAAYDYSPGDGWAIGASAGLLDIFTSQLSVRAAARVLGTDDGPSLGLGGSLLLVQVSGYRLGEAVGLQPAVVFSTPLLVPWMRLRGQIGPYLWSSNPVTVDFRPLGAPSWESGMAAPAVALRSLELAVGSDAVQLTLGGGTLAGLRFAL